MDKTVPKQTTRIFKCKCKHAYQDAEYGAGMRVCNLKAKKGKQGDKHAFGCTVCGSLHL